MIDDWKRPADDSGIHGLCLTRYMGQVVVIEHAGQTLRLAIMGRRGNQMRLVFDGPRDFVILREEVAEREAAGRENVRDLAKRTAPALQEAIDNKLLRP